MKVYKMIFSPTGGTMKAADLLLKSWKEEQVFIDLLERDKDFSCISFSEKDVCLAAVPSYGGRVPEPAIQRVKEMHGNGAKVILMVVYGNRAYEDTMLELYDALAEVGFIPIAGVASVAEHSIMRQFAAGRPDSRDEKELEEYGKQIHARIGECRLNREDVPGNKPYREFGGVPMKPEAGKACDRNKLLLMAGAKTLKKACGTRKENELLI